MTPLQVRRRVAEAVARQGWPDGLEHTVRALDPASARRVQYELWLRHTAWKSFFDPRYRSTAWVFDTGYGSLAISLARDYAQVYAYPADPEATAITRARAGWLGIRNIEFVRQPCSSVSLDAAAMYCVPGCPPAHELLAAVQARMAPHGCLYVGVPARGGALTAWRTLRRLREWFPRIHTFRSETEGELAESYELTSCDRVLSLRSLIGGAAFGLVASKSGAAAPLIDSVLAPARRRLAEDTPLERERMVLASPNGMTIIAREQASQRRFVVRIPLDLQSVDRNNANRRALLATERLAEDLRDATPRHLLSGSVSGCPYYVESAVSGEPAAALLRREETGAAALRASLEWIGELHARTVTPCPAGSEAIQKLTLNALRHAFEAFRFPEWRPGFDRMSHLLTAALRSSALPLVFSHGDYSIDNVLLAGTPPCVTGVIDWDLAVQHGLPLLDPLYFVASAERARRREPIGRVFRNVIFPMRFDAGVRDVLDRYCRALNIPQHLVGPLSVVAWLHHAGIRMANPERYRFSAEGIESGADAFPDALELLEQGAAAMEFRSATA